MRGPIRWRAEGAAAGEEGPSPRLITEMRAKRQGLVFCPCVPVPILPPLDVATNKAQPISDVICPERVRVQNGAVDGRRQSATGVRETALR
jgi:hypothetical protein